ncbi:hypothetical protein [Endozoicomonas sp. 8E]|uniref:hypothetical protein n=1 Tax=Endozoicomonas sp. 8E TaxID=3035692 RepID=UPI0029390917|nr:hypothetical protein [Endozoicomonas sp. 8E]WOG27053.1 hypothetical protein P6910_21260 [Endozoicomonas sp. 8E]
MALLLLLLSLNVICPAKPLTRRFTVELEQEAGFLKQSFSVKHDQHILLNNPSNIADTNGYAEPDWPPDEKQQKSYNFRLPPPLTEPISWQLLYATHLLVAYELILTTKGAALSSSFYSWIPLEAAVAVGWLLKCYWNPDSHLFSTIEQQQINQDYPFMAITLMFGSGRDQPGYQPSKSSNQKAPATATRLTRSLIRLQNTDGGGGNGNPQKDLHTLGLNCFVRPCNGVCRFRSSSDSREPAEWPLNTHSQYNPSLETLNDFPAIQLQCASDQPSQPQTQHHGVDGNPTSCNHSLTMTTEAAYTGHSVALNGHLRMPRNMSITDDDLVIINGLLNLRGHSLSEAIRISFTLNHLTSPVATSETQQTTRPTQVGQNPPHPSRTGEVQASDYSGLETCDATVVGDDGQQRQCGKIFKSFHSLTGHRRRNHGGQKVCDVTLFSEDGQRPCGTVCRNAQALADHKLRIHTGQQTCGVIVVAEDGQLQTCGKIFKNAKALTSHRSKYHTGQKTCDTIMVNANGQQRPCGRIYKNNQALWDHKNREHSEQKICTMTVVGKDNQQRPCGKVYNNAQAFSSHKSRVHSEQKTCDVALAGKDGRPELCGAVCKNIGSLMAHKRKGHSGQKTCAVRVIKEDGQRRRCGKVCENAQVLSHHKGIHRKRKPVNPDQDDGFKP